MDDEDDTISDNNVEVELLPLTKMMTRLTSPEFITCIKNTYGTKHSNGKISGGLRNFYEKSTPTTQCNNVLKSTPLVFGQTKCWICGFTIPNNTDPALRPECEHVFPIAQALFFIGLYSNEHKDDVDYLEKLKLEYGWSHSVCNQIKNDSHFIEHTSGDETQSRWFVKQTKINDFINDILVRGNKYGKGADKLKKLIIDSGKTIPKWTSERSEHIKQRSEAILKTILPTNENLWVLAFAADISFQFSQSKCVEEVIPPQLTHVALSKGKRRLLSNVEIQNYCESYLKYLKQKTSKHTLEFTNERPSLRRMSAEEKIEKVNAVLKFNEQDYSSLLPAIFQLYNSINNLPIPDTEKDPRFIEGILYTILGRMLNSMTVIFASYTTSPSLQKLSNEFRATLQSTRDIWASKGLNVELAKLDAVLRGGRRRRSHRRTFRIKNGFRKTRRTRLT